MLKYGFYKSIIHQNSNNFTIQNTVCILYGTEVSAHTAGVFFLRFGLCAVASCFLRIHAEFEHFFPVKTFFSLRSSYIILRHRELLGNISSMSSNLAAIIPLLHQLHLADEDVLQVLHSRGKQHLNKQQSHRRLRK